MLLRELLSLPSFRHARVVAGDAGLDRPVRWVHVVDLPDPLPWVRPAQLLLSTGVSWPRDDLGALQGLVRALAHRNVSGIMLAVPHYFSTFPDVMRQEADRWRLPLIEIPWHVPFFRLMEDAHRAILTQQYALLEQSEQIHRRLLEASVHAESLTDLCQVLADVVASTVLATDRTGLVLTAATPRQDDAQAVTNLSHGRQLIELVTGQLAAIGRDYRARAFHVWISDRPYYGAYVPVVLHGELIAVLWALRHEPAPPLLHRALEYAALLTALHLAHQRALAEQAVRLGYAFLDSLLEGRFEPTEQALERARLLGYDPRQTYRLLLVMLSEMLPLNPSALARREELAARLSTWLTARGVAPILSPIADFIAVLVPEIPNLVQDLWDEIAAEVFALIVSRPCCMVEDIHVAYKQGVSTARAIHQPGCYAYEALLVPRALTGDQLAQRELVQALLDGLHDVRQGQAIRKTVTVWTQVGFSVERAAERLGVHPNTVRYRLRRAEALLGRSLEDAELRFQLKLAVLLEGLQHS